MGTLLLYAPALFFQFIYYDDNAYVFENAHVLSGLSPEFFKWFLTANVTGNWHPVTMFSHALDCQLFGMWAGGHHLTSILFHATNAVLIFILFLKMTHSPFKSFLVAAIFAWHPVKVESVAWVAERKDVLSTFFILLSLLSYTSYIKTQGIDTKDSSRKYYFLCSLFFVLSLMSKPMYVTLPIILLLFDFWPIQRMSRGVVALIFEKIPFFFFAFIFSLIAMRFQAESGAIQHFTDFPIFIRIANILRSYWDYLVLFFWPAKLSVFYPYVPNAPIGLSAMLGLIVIILTGILFKKRNGLPALWVGWCLFGICLLPVIGIVKLGAHWIACRYLYWPAVGLSITLVWGGEMIANKMNVSKKIIALLVSLLLAAYAGTSSVYLEKWQNSYALFSHAEKTISHNWVAHINLRAAYGRDGHHEKAAEHYLEAIKIFPGVMQRIKPHWLDFYYMGKVNWKNGKIPQAESFLNEAARLIAEINPDSFHPDTLNERRLIKTCLAAARANRPSDCPF